MAGAAGAFIGECVGEIYKALGEPEKPGAGATQEQTKAYEEQYARMQKIGTEISRVAAAVALSSMGFEDQDLVVGSTEAATTARENALSPTEQVKKISQKFEEIENEEERNKKILETLQAEEKELQEKIGDLKPVYENALKTEKPDFDYEFFNPELHNKCVEVCQQAIQQQDFCDQNELKLNNNRIEIMAQKTQGFKQAFSKGMQMTAHATKNEMLQEEYNNLSEMYARMRSLTNLDLSYRLNDLKEEAASRYFATKQILRAVSGNSSSFDDIMDNLRFTKTSNLETAKTYLGGQMDYHKRILTGLASFAVLTSLMVGFVPTVGAMAGAGAVTFIEDPLKNEFTKALTEIGIDPYRRESMASMGVEATKFVVSGGGAVIGAKASSIIGSKVSTLAGLKVPATLGSRVSKNIGSRAHCTKVKIQPVAENINNNSTSSSHGALASLPRAKSALKVDSHHNFNQIIDNYADSAKKFQIPTFCKTCQLRYIIDPCVHYFFDFIFI